MSAAANSIIKKPGGRGRIFSCLLIAGLCCIAIFGADLADYSKRLGSAHDELKALVNYAEDVRDGDDRDVDIENSVISNIRKALPVSEKIEWMASTAEVDNKWLHERLDAYQTESDKIKRLAIIKEAEERIGALRAKVKELENPPVSGRTKDEDKQKLGEILQREEYRIPEKNTDENIFQRWWREFLDWLSRVFPRPNMPDVPDTGMTSLSFVLQIVLYAAVIGLIGFLLYRFAPLLFGAAGRRVRKEKKDRVILGERIAAEESAESLFDEAERLARDGNLRGAIRKGYIALLCELSDRKIIGLAQHKTNRDYLRDVRNRGELFQNMNGMTVSFERHWYGFQTPENSDWDEFRQGFRRATGTQATN
jgi:hypothetical protein